MFPGDPEAGPKNRGALSPGIIGGVIVMAVGVILLLHTNDIIDARDIFRFWPLGLIALGLAKLLGSRGGSGRVWGVAVAFIGFVFSFSVIFRREIDFERIWPFFVIAWGLVLLWGAVESRRRRPDETAVTPATQISEWAICGGGERQIATREFEGGELLAIMGGWQVDLSKAGMKGNEATIEINCIFGGAGLRVPEDWDVILRGIAIFGAYADKTRHPRPEDIPHAKRLIIKGMTMFGGVEVKN